MIRGIARQRGVALITVLLVMVIAIAALSHTITRDHIAMSRSAAILANVQLGEFVSGAEAWAQVALQRDHESDGEDTNSADSRLDDWARQALSFNPDNGKMIIRISDLNSCFNVNSLVGAAATDGAGGPGAASEQMTVFKRLVSSVTGKPELAEVIQDWVDRGDTPQARGVEDNGYMGRELSHRTPDGPITDVSELSVVEGMEPADWDALAPFLCALPEGGTEINVNFAPEELLEAMAPTANVAQIVSFRDSDGVISEPSQLETYGLNGVNGLTFHSRYFLARIAVQLGEEGDHSQYWESMLHLSGDKVRVVQRQRRMFTRNRAQELLGDTPLQSQLTDRPANGRN